MKFSLFKEYGALNSKPVFEAFEQSLVDAGHNIYQNNMNCDVAVIWSVLFNGRMAGNKTVWDHYRKNNKNVIVLEVGGIKRGTTWKVGLNGINRDAYFGPGGMDDIRSRNLGLELKPWRNDGEFILICGQHDKSLQWQGMHSMSRWVMNTIEALQLHYDYPIIFRPHPRCKLPDIERQYKNVFRQDPRPIVNTYDDFDMNFNNIKFTVSWNSNPGVHSIIQGVPAFVGPSSLAWDVGCPHLLMADNPYRPDRTQWLNDYAYTEWTIDEIRQGLPLKRLTPKLENATI
jgi:hypothetical protein